MVTLYPKTYGGMHGLWTCQVLTFDNHTNKKGEVDEQAMARDEAVDVIPTRKRCPPAQLSRCAGMSLLFSVKWPSIRHSQSQTEPLVVSLRPLLHRHRQDQAPPHHPHERRLSMSPMRSSLLALATPPTLLPKSEHSLFAMEPLSKKPPTYLEMTIPSCKPLGPTSHHTEMVVSLQHSSSMPSSPSSPKPAPMLSVPLSVNSPTFSRTRQRVKLF